MLPIRTTVKKIHLEYRERIQHESFYFNCVDPTGQGHLQRLIGFRKPTINISTIQLFDSTGQRPLQFNIQGVTDTGLPVVKIADFDQNDSIELYTFYHVDSSLYLDVIFPYDPDMTKKYQKIFIDSLITVPNYALSYAISNVISLNSNKHSENRVYFTVMGSMRTFYPRKIYSLDMGERKIRSSESYGNMIGALFAYDTDHDGIPEIMGSCGAPDNIDLDYGSPYHDKSSWFMAFTPELEFKYEPSEYAGKMYNFNPFLSHYDGKEALLAMTTNSGIEPNPAFLMKYKKQAEFEIIDTLGNGSYSGVHLLKVTHPENLTYVKHFGRDHVSFLDASFVETKSISFKGPVVVIPPTDLDSNGRDEVIIQPAFRSEINIYSGQGEYLAYHDFKTNAIGFRHGMTTLKGVKMPYVLADNELIYYSLRNNPWHYLKWFALIGLILVIYIFSRLSIAIQNRQNQRVKLVSNKMRALELQSIKNQLDPHFTFNALNVLNYLSDKNDTKGVHDFTMHFSKLIRRQLEMSDKPSVTLYDELRFVRHYIELQKLRFDIPILYDEEVDSSVDMNLRIPKMMIHTHVENAIKHGLLPTGKGGTIRASIKSAKKQTTITITDNGQGFKHPNHDNTYNHNNNDNPKITPQPDNKSTGQLDNRPTSPSGRGLQILNQLYHLYHQLYKVKITQQIKPNTPTGTKVIITIPK